MPISPPPDAPTPDDRPPIFNTKGFAWVAQWNVSVGELNLLEANVVAKEASAVAAAVSAAAAAAAAAVTATKWVSGAFTDGDVRWSPLSYQSYRKKGTGAGTTDPSLDPVNWVALTAGPAISTLVYTRDNYGAL